MRWSKCEGIWTIHYRVGGTRYYLEISPRFDMSDCDTPIDLERMNEVQLILSYGPSFLERDDIFFGYYSDRIMAAKAGLHIFHYMKGRIIKPRRINKLLILETVTVIMFLMIFSTSLR